MRANSFFVHAFPLDIEQLTRSIDNGPGLVYTVCIIIDMRVIGFDG